MLVLVGVDGKLHFRVPFMNRLNQTELSTFSILSFWAFFRDSFYFILLLLEYGALILNEGKNKTKQKLRK
jgi:hypothetical protein